MILLRDLQQFIDLELEILQPGDDSNNGLQVEGRREIKKIGFAVDACLDVFNSANKKNCDMIIVHHGLSFQDSLKYITNVNYKRIKYLIKNDISLYAAHLPLDNHPKIGNNIVIAKKLMLNKIKKFGFAKGTYWGYTGEKSTTINGMVMQLEKIGLNAKVLRFGKENIKTIAVVSGSGGGFAEEAICKKIDILVTGEVTHKTYHLAKDEGLNIIYCGHYATEIFGVKALMEMIKKKFRVEAVFIDAETGF